MKTLRNIGFLTAILVALFFVFSEKQAPESKSVPNPAGHYAQDGLHALAFIQPETAHPVISPVKSFAFSTARLATFLTVDFARPVQLKLRKNFLLQDADRCQSVSLLLFPYHIFW